jgi:hypothetical protein
MRKPPILVCTFGRHNCRPQVRLQVNGHGEESFTRPGIPKGKAPAKAGQGSQVVTSRGSKMTVPILVQFHCGCNDRARD